MQFEHIQTLPGSPEPADFFEPYMPDVDLLSDMDGFFIQVRQLLEAEDTNEYIQQSGLGLFIPPDHQDREIPRGQRHVAIITPGRMFTLAPAPRPNTKSEKELAPLRKLLPSENPL